jgi:hypothetical protein
MIAAIVARHHQRQLERIRAPGCRRGWCSAADALADQQRALPHIVEDQRGQHEEQPRDADRVAPEMAHIGIERLGARHRQHDRAERQEGRQRIAHEELAAHGRRQRPQISGVWTMLSTPSVAITAK